MQTKWLIKGKSDTLTVVVLGWATPVEVIPAEIFESDVLAIFDYIELEKNSLPDGYKRKHLIAWSFGVWVAEQIFADEHFDYAVALCGSPLPASNEYGIGLKRLQLSIRGGERFINQFIETSYGKYRQVFESFFKGRDKKRDLEELQLLVERSNKPYTPTIKWNEAVIGSEDTIFMQKNLENYWLDRANILPLCHYPFMDWKPKL